MELAATRMAAGIVLGAIRHLHGGRPTLTALAATILVRHRSYYETLEASNKSTEITAWLGWSAGIALEAQQRPFPWYPDSE